MQQKQELFAEKFLLSFQLRILLRTLKTALVSNWNEKEISHVNKKNVSVILNFLSSCSIFFKKLSRLCKITIHIANKQTNVTGSE